MEPEQTPFAAVTAQTSRVTRVCPIFWCVLSNFKDTTSCAINTQINANSLRDLQQYQAWLDKSTPYTPYRWIGTVTVLGLFFIRIFVVQGWYIGSFPLFPLFTYPIKKKKRIWLLIKFIYTVAYSLGIYLLNLFLAFLQPKFDPSNEAIDNEMEDGAIGALPTKQDEEFRPFIRRLPEFKFWYSATRAIVLGFVCTWFEIFDVPVFWPVLVVYWLILFCLTSKSSPFDEKTKREPKK